MRTFGASSRGGRLLANGALQDRKQRYDEVSAPLSGRVRRSFCLPVPVFSSHNLPEEFLSEGREGGKEARFRNPFEQVVGRISRREALRHVNFACSAARTLVRGHLESSSGLDSQGFVIKIKVFVIRLSPLNESLKRTLFVSSPRQGPTDKL